MRGREDRREGGGLWHLLPTLPLPFVPHKGGEWRQSPLAQVCQVLRAGDKVGEAGREGHSTAWARSPESGFLLVARMG